AVLGIDPVERHLVLSRAALEATQNAKLASLVNFAHGTAEAIPVDDAAVDLVWCREVIALVPADRAFAEFARVLRPGGKAVVYMVLSADSARAARGRRALATTRRST